MGEERMTTETAHESICEIEDMRQASLFHELNCKGELQQGGFIVSPADVATREKPKLKDAEVPEEWKKKLHGPKVLCCCRLHTHWCRASQTYPKCVTNSSTCQS